MANMYPSKKAGGGGAPTETTLWTNSAPTSSFAGQRISVSRTTMQAYDYIKVEFRLATNDSNTISVIIDSAEFTTDDTNRRYAVVKLGGSYDYVRHFCDYNSSQITFSSVSTIGSGTGNNTYLIPTRVIGIKYT